MTPWTYHSGVTGTGSCERVYEHSSGLVGKVVRTRGSAATGDWGEGRVSYFVWRARGMRPEYATMDEALAAAGEAIAQKS